MEDCGYLGGRNLSHHIGAVRRIAADHREPQGTGSCSLQTAGADTGPEEGGTAGADPQEEAGIVDAGPQMGYRSSAAAASMNCARRVAPVAVPGCESKTAGRKVADQEGEGRTGCAIRCRKRAAEDTDCCCVVGCAGWGEESGRTKIQCQKAPPTQVGYT